MVHCEAGGAGPAGNRKGLRSGGTVRLDGDASAWRRGMTSGAWHRRRAIEGVPEGNRRAECSFMKGPNGTR